MLSNKIGAANTRHAEQLRDHGFSFITVAFRGQSPAAVADLYLALGSDASN